MIPSQADFSPQVVAWAKSLVNKDREFVEHRARFASEPIRSIAKLVLSAAGVEEHRNDNEGKATTDSPSAAGKHYDQRVQS